MKTTMLYILILCGIDSNAPLSGQIIQTRKESQTYSSALPTIVQENAAARNLITPLFEKSEFHSAFRLHRIESFESGTTSRDRAKEGAIAGFIVGGVTGLTIGLLEFEDDCPPENFPEGVPNDASDEFCVGFSRTKKVIIGTFFPSVIGTGAGYLIGKLFKTESQAKIHLNQLQIDFPRRYIGLSMNVMLKF